MIMKMVELVWLVMLTPYVLQVYLDVICKLIKAGSSRRDYDESSSPLLPIVEKSLVLSSCFILVIRKEMANLAFVLSFQTCIWLDNMNFLLEMFSCRTC